MTITYTLGIPNGPNDPSDDQPLMQVNNDANAQIWGVDHITFNDDEFPNGTHVSVTFTVPGSDPALNANQTQLYSKSFGNATTYLETYTAAKPSSGAQINGYLPFVKCMTAFQSLTAPGNITPILNTLSVNIASMNGIVQTAPSAGTSQIVITFAAALPYATYYLFFDVESAIPRTITRTTTSITLSGQTSGVNNMFFGFMVI